SARLVEKAQHWRSGSLWSRAHGDEAIKALPCPWPLRQPANWTARVNTPLNARELGRVRVSLERGRPYGDEGWVRQTVKAPGLEHTISREGRPRKANNATDQAASSKHDRRN